MNARAFTPPRLFTVAEYHRMADAAIFTDDDRVELIEGEVVAMSPIGSRHAACVDKINALLKNLLSGETAIVRAQSPVQLNNLIRSVRFRASRACFPVHVSPREIRPNQQHDPCLPSTGSRFPTSSASP